MTPAHHHLLRDPTEEIPRGDLGAAQRTKLSPRERPRKNREPAGRGPARLGTQPQLPPPARVVVERTVRRSRSLLVKCGVGQFKQPFTRIKLRLDLVPAKEPESAIADLGCRKAERLPGVQRSRVKYKIGQLARVTGVVFVDPLYVVSFRSKPDVAQWDVSWPPPFRSSRAGRIKIEETYRFPVQVPLVQARHAAPERVFGQKYPQESERIHEQA